MPAEPELQFTTADIPEESIEFSIDGESFHAHSWMTGMQFLRYSRQLTSGGLASAVLVEDFFRESMNPDEYERFIKFCEDPARRVTTSVLGQIFEMLFARYAAGPKESDRPTEPPKP